MYNNSSLHPQYGANSNISQQQSSLGVGGGFNPTVSFRRNLYNEHQQITQQHQPQQMFPLHTNQIHRNQPQHYPLQQQHSSPRINSADEYDEMYSSEKLQILNSKAKLIPRQDPFCNYLEYSLRLGIGSVSSTAFRIYSLKEASDYHQFRSSIGNEGLLDVWINLNDLETLGA